MAKVRTRLDFTDEAEQLWESLEEMLREDRASSICERLPEQADADDERKHGLNSAEERPKNAEGVYKNGKSPRLTII